MLYICINVNDMNSANDYKNRFINKEVDVNLILHMLEVFCKLGIHTAIQKVRTIYPQLTDQDVDDLVGEYATSPYKFTKKP